MLHFLIQRFGINASHLNNFFTLKNYRYSSILTMSAERMCNDAKEIFQAAVLSVEPENLINKSVLVHSNSMQIQDSEFDLEKNVYIVGFGKAVLGMACALENKLKEHLVSGILSVPEGSENLLGNEQNSCLQIFKGAPNNIPDENSHMAANKISELVASLKLTDLLFVLISGGGSALLPSPKPQITLEEKVKVIQLLASKGASIEELNAVRKRLSNLKGGGLAELAKPAKVISLILSDIIGDSISSIASGPTVKNIDHPKLPLDIIEKYKLENEIPRSVLILLTDLANKEISYDHGDFPLVNNFVIGNNQSALDAAAITSNQLGYEALTLTNEFSGMARIVGRKLMAMIVSGLEGNSQEATDISEDLNIPKKSFQSLMNFLLKLKLKHIKLCILLGGETTVEVRGLGVGGRNQELALSAGIELNQRNPFNDVVVLSSGTDGIDGPTDAAGAIATKCLVESAKNKNLNPYQYLDNNDSYTFFSKACDGRFHVKTGHTGTNVMDIIVILIE